jgi:hypothetical protein
MKEAVLVLGAGNSPRQILRVHSQDETPPGEIFAENFKNVWTIDMDPASHPKVVWDLETTTEDGEELSWPVPEHFFDEVHAYEVLEHLGGIGNYRFFFALWRKIWRVLKPGGLVCASTPWWTSPWALADPGHRDVYSVERLTYLLQKEYEQQIGVTTMTDYRQFWPKPYDFSLVNHKREKESFLFVLQKEGSFASANESGAT